MNHPQKQKMLGQTGINRNNVHEFPNSRITRKTGSDQNMKIHSVVQDFIKISIIHNCTSFIWVWSLVTHSEKNYRIWR